MRDEPLEKATEALVVVIRESVEYRQYQVLREAVMAEEGTRVMLREYQRVQSSLQMATMTGQEGEVEDVRRFSQLTALLFDNPEISQYLLAKLSLQNKLGEVLQRLTDAAGLDTDVAGMEGGY